VLLLDALRDLERVLGRHGLAAVAHHLLDESSDVAAGERDVPDARADHVALDDRDDVRHAVSRVDNCSGEDPV